MGHTSSEFRRVVGRLIVLVFLMKCVQYSALEISRGDAGVFNFVMLPLGIVGLIIMVYVTFKGQ